MKYFITIMFFCLTQMVVASELTLLEPISINKEEDIVKAQLPNQQFSNIQVIGRFKTSQLTKNNKLIQIVWTCVSNDQNKSAALDHPLVSVVKVKKEIPAGLKISFTGDAQEILKAIEKLNRGESQQESIKDAENPQSNERHVLVVQNDKQRNETKAKSSKRDEEKTDAAESSALDHQGASRAEPSSYSNSNSSWLPDDFASHGHRSSIEGLTSSMNAQSAKRPEKKKDQSTINTPQVSPVGASQQINQQRDPKKK
jgi:hypothetical protein